MTSVLVLGWALAASAAVLLLLERRQARLRAEHVVRACHELRQPLTAMLMALTPSGGRMGPLGEALAPELDRARRAAEQLADDAERRLGPPTLQEVDVVAAVTAQARLHDAVAAAQGRRVRVLATDGDAVLPADRGRLAQAVGNLLGNALQHGHGDVRVTVAQEEGGLSVAVRDDGPGLPDAPDRLGRRRGRHGRGLAIACAAAADHGGRVVRRGSAVVLELPRSAASGVGPAPGGAPDATPSRPTPEVPGPRPSRPLLTRRLGGAR